MITIAILVTTVALIIYIKNGQAADADSKDVEAPLSLKRNNITIYVDMSGAVKKPDLYEVPDGIRIKEIIDKAGGLSEDADLTFFKRNFNLAKIVTDQEKIYIPSIAEIGNGLFSENQQAVDYLSPTTLIAASIGTDAKSQLISLNSGTIEELDSLPGIGVTTANKIISNRPYTNLEDLISKKSVNKGVFEKIKNLISL